MENRLSGFPGNDASEAASNTAHRRRIAPVLLVPGEGYFPKA